MKHSKLIIVLLIIISIIACTTNKSTIEPNTSGKPAETTDNTTVFSQNYAGHILVKGLQRSYLVHLPASYDKSRLWPLVIVLHGGGSEAKTMDPMTGFNTLADKQGFVIVYPDAYKHPDTGAGMSQHWNDGRGEQGIRSQTENIDDVAFISALIDRLSHDLNIDAKMVYATGISNGALMSHRLACELSDKIAAIAPVAGNIPQKTASTWSPSHTISVLIINGTEDPVMPFAGGDVSFLSLKTGKVLSVADSVKFWFSKDGCQAEPEVEQLAQLDPDDSTSTIVKKYTGCREGAEVVLYQVNGGGHTWPGGLQYMSEIIIGRTSRDFNATETIWQFFKLHPMKQ